jgi:hypothetical protein
MIAVCKAHRDPRAKSGNRIDLDTVELMTPLTVACAGVLR